jgi:hypothetical protein
MRLRLIPLISSYSWSFLPTTEKAITEAIEYNVNKQARAGGKIRASE